MDNLSIIDKNTFEVFKHEEECPFAFVCDKHLATVIAELNKKGYETYASCSGHYKSEFYEWFDEDISNLEECKNDSKIIITEIRQNSFDYISIIDKTVTYILFTKKYEFDKIPEQFEIYEFDDDRTCIESYINYYDENNKRKKRGIVEKEIEQRCNLLKEWVNNLPDMKGNDKYE